MPSPTFSICGLPYHLSGDVPDWRSLAHRTSADLEATGLELLLDHTAQAIDLAAKQVSVTDSAGAERQLVDAPRARGLPAWGFAIGWPG
jgi:NADPH-dependent 2,4-dienoyl-CoA reductase/sulfur reductase-like enzyme